MSCSIYSDRDHQCTEDCRKQFESTSTYCGNCWKLVTNAAYFGKRNNSPHITGKCKERFEIPKSAFERTVNKKSWSLGSFQHSSEIAAELNRKAGYPKKHWSEIDPLEQRIRLLEEQNRLLRLLAA